MKSVICFLLVALFSPFAFLICLIIRWAIISFVESFKKSKLSKNRRLYQLIFFCHFFTCICTFFLIQYSLCYFFLLPFFLVGFFAVLKWDLYLDSCSREYFYKSGDSYADRNDV